MFGIAPNSLISVFTVSALYFHTLKNNKFLSTKFFSDLFIILVFIFYDNKGKVFIRTAELPDIFWILYYDTNRKAWIRFLG
jgi:hypothetical protein